MKQIYVNQIGERDPVDAVFLVRDRTQAMARNGKPYMTLKLMDRTGEIEARVWERVDELARLFDKNDFVRIRGRGNLYMGKMQLVVQQLERVSEESIDLADFLPVSQRPLVEMRAELDRLLASMSDGPLRQLMHAFFDDNEFFKLYSRAPAAKGMHHVFIGGLLEHSLAVAALACDVAQRYAQVDRDLLIAGALMHDIGKTAELCYERAFDYTDEGKLIGHIVMGVEMIEERSRTIADFPRQQAMLLKHLLLSHHGQYEYGSPKRPKMLEAVILNFIDDLDSKINGIQTHIDKEPQRTGDWTGYHRLYDRYFYAPHEPQDAGVIPEAVPVQQAPPVASPKKARRSRTETLGFTLGEQLAGQNLNLFGNDNDKKEDQ